MSQITNFFESKQIRKSRFFLIGLILMAGFFVGVSAVLTSRQATTASIVRAEVKAAAAGDIATFTGLSPVPEPVPAPTEEVIEEEGEEQLPPPPPPPTEGETEAIQQLLQELLSPIATVGEPDFGLTGIAEVRGDAIFIQGVSGLPNSIITLTLNDTIIFVVTSDSAGTWSTLISAEQLGLVPGEEITLAIKGVAAKGNLKSNQIDEVVTFYLAQTGATLAQLESQAPLKAKFYKNPTFIIWIILLLILIILFMVSISHHRQHGRHHAQGSQ